MGKFKILTVLMVCCMAGVSCSGSGSSNIVGSNEVTLGIEGGHVDPVLMAQLSAELERALSEFGSLKRAATAPTGDRSKVMDLAINVAVNGEATLSWSYRNQGDYDQNGEVNQADLSQLALHYGMKEGQDGWDSAQPVDGDGNGEINLADVAPIAMNFKNSVQGYLVQASRKLGYFPWWEEYASVPLNSSVVPDGGGIKQFVVNVPTPTYGNYLRVVPHIKNQFGSTEFGIASNEAETADARGDWSMRGRDPQHTGRSPFVSAQTNNLKWKFRTTGAGTSYEDATVDPDGIIYVGAGSDLHCLNPDGSVRWYFESCQPTGRPALAQDGTIYFSSEQNILFAVNPDGSLKWSAPTLHWQMSPPVVGADGTVYVGGNKLYAFNPDGSEKWSYLSNGKMWSKPALAEDGTIYCGRSDDENMLYALNSNGTKKWTFPTDDNLVSAPAIGQDGTLYIGSSDKRLYAINPDGSLFWSFLTEDSLLATPVMNANGSILASGGNGTLYSLNPNGTLDWKFTNSDEPLATPVIGFNGSINVGSRSGSFISLNPDGGIAWERTFQGGVYRTAAISPDGMLLIGNSNGEFHALDSDGNLLWTNTAGGSIYSTVVGAGGEVYFTCSDDNLYSLNPDGSLRWSYSVEEAIPYGGGLTLSRNGLLLFSSGGDYLHVLSTDKTLDWTTYDEGGQIVIDDEGFLIIASNDLSKLPPFFNGDPEWSIFNDGNFWTFPVIGLNGVIYVGDYKDNLFAINPDGTEKWSFPTTTSSFGSTSVGADGTIYCGSNQPEFTLRAINPDGTLKWTYGAPVLVLGMAIGLDGTLYIVGPDRLLQAISPDGNQIWSFETEGASSYSPAIGGDGTIYFGSNDFKVYAVNPDGSEKWSHLTGGSISTSPTIGSDGTLYIGSSDGNLYAFGD